MFRSDATKSTLSLYINRTSQLQKWLGIVFVLMLLGSLTMVFAGLVLHLSYYMDKLDFVSKYFTILPWLLFGVGLSTFVYATCGSLLSTSESRYVVLAIGLLAVPLCLLQLGTVFVSMEARREINSDVFDTKTRSAAAEYSKNQDDPTSSRDAWDFLQSRLRCCGAFSYNDYTSQVSPNFRCVPESCCWNYREPDAIPCTQSLVPNSCNKVEVIADKIYVRGCMDVLDQLYKTELQVPLLIYGLLGTILALVDLTAAALCFGYAGQLVRRQKKERAFEGQGGGFGGGLGEGNGGETLRRAQEDNQNISMDEYQHQEE